MKLESTMKAEVIAKSSDKSKDGQTTYYRLTILQGSESGKLSCAQDVYDKVENRKEYAFITQFNDEYKSFRIIGMVNDGIPSSATTPGGRSAAPATATK